MGAYINPKDMRKEEWLGRYAVIFNHSLKWADVPNGYLPICLVDNGPFTTAGIAYCEEEWIRFRKPEDLRPKVWFIALIEKLHTVSPELIKYMKGK